MLCLSSKLIPGRSSLQSRLLEDGAPFEGDIKKAVKEKDAEALTDFAKHYSPEDRRKKKVKKIRRAAEKKRGSELNDRYKRYYAAAGGALGGFKTGGAPWV